MKITTLTARKSFSVFAIVMLLATVACALPGRRVDEDATDEPPVVQEGGATPLPTVDVAQLPPTAPQLVAMRPAPGEELPLDGSIDLYFDQPMDRDSVEDALRFSPVLDVALTWVDDSTLRITPAEGQLERATRYEIDIAASATSLRDLTLEDALDISFQTIGFLEVGEVVPAPDSGGVATDAVITVFFNRPVVPLGIAEDAPGLPQPLSFEPAVPGTGEWVNTSIYMWRPDDPLAGGQTYQARVVAGLEDQTGGLLEDDYTWSFETLPPDVVSVVPTEGSTNVRLDSTVIVEFNQPMDQASVADGFSLTDNNTGREVEGRFTWDEKGQIATFKPAGLMPLDGDMTASLGANILGVTGNVTLAQTISWNFSVARTPAVVRTEPANGANGVNVYQGIEILFASEMDDGSVDDRLTIDPPLSDDTFVFSGEAFGSDANLWRYSISTQLQPSTRYTVTLAPGAEDPYGNTITTPYSFSFTAGPLDPLVQLNTDGLYGLYDANRPTELFALYRNIDYIDLRLVEVSLQEFGRLTSDFSVSEFQPSSDRVLRSWRIGSEGALNELTYANIEVTAEEEGSLAPGIYLLIADAPEIRGDIRHFMIVTTANLTYKESFDESLLWLTDLETGQPLNNVPVTLYNDDFVEIASGRTRRDGSLEIDTPHSDVLWDTSYAVAQNNRVFSVAMTNWSEGISPWEYNLPSQWDFQDYSLYVYTDRPLYRPGQTMFFKGILRSKNDVEYDLPTRQEVQVWIRNDQGEEVWSERMPLNEMGSFNGSFTIDPDASLGFYGIEVEVVPDLTNFLGFQVAEFARPEFQVSVNPEAEEVLAGDTIEVTVDASFFFGGPVSAADVSWSVLSTPYDFFYEGTGRFTFFDAENAYDFGPDFIPGFGNVIADGEGRTNADGELVLRIPAELSQESGSQTFIIEAVVTDINERSVAGRTEVVVHKAEYYAGVQPDAYVGEANREMSATIKVVDWDSDDVPNVDVVVQVFEERWNSVREEDEFGRTQWVWSVENVEVGDPIEVTADGDGLAEITFVPPTGGTYKIRAMVTDNEGNENSGTGFVWVTGGAFVSWRQSNDFTFELVADSDSYEPGDTAELLIASPFSGTVQALVAVERGSILSYEVIELKSNSEVYELDITGEHAPNIFVSVILIKGVDATNPVPGFKMGQVKLDVSPVEQTLNVEVTPDSTQVGPGEEVTYEVRTTDSKGRPVDAEVSLALVDLATLSLASPNSGPILEHFYGNQGLGVRTAVPMTILVDRRNQELFDQGKGGGGGGSEGFFDIRSEFKDTAHWAATVRTGDDGRSTVTITLPDNLTTWRMDARALTEDTLVGQDTIDIVATKPLLLRPNTPRFLIVGDEVQMGAVINNNTEDAIDAVASLEASGVTLEGEAVQSVTIPAGGRVEVVWPVTVDFDTEWVDMVFRVEGGGLSDAARPILGDPANGQKLPVYRYDVPETVGTAGQLIEGGQRLEGVVLPPTYDVTQGNLTVQVNPSLAAATLDSLTWLEQYPYTCTEQTVSRFLPNVATLRVLTEFGVSNASLEENLNVQVNRAIQQLYAQQHVDGGWGWFVNNASSPTVTAYVLQGFIAAREAGISIDAQVMADGFNYLTSRLQPLDVLDSHELLDRQAYMLYVLALGDRPDVSRTNQLYEERAGLQNWALGLLAQTLWMIDPSDSRLDVIESDLTNAAILSATGAHWEEDTRDHMNWNTNTRTTAIVLDTYAKLWPESELAPNAVRWLMVAREADHWTTTQETVWALLALTNWMSATGELNADYEWEFAFNGIPLMSGRALNDTLTETQKVVIDLANMLPDEVNRLAFDRTSGDGRMYYTAHLTAYLPVEEVDPLSRGIVVTRRYLNEEGDPVTQGRLGDVLTVEVTVIAPRLLNFVVIEDFYPAGAEAVDTTLLTESIFGEPPGLHLDDPLYKGWGYWNFSEVDLRDEKAVLYADQLPAGTYQFIYQIRLGLVGEYRVIPTVGWEFYFPEVYGRGEGMIFNILPEN